MKRENEWGDLRGKRKRREVGREGREGWTDRQRGGKRGGGRKRREKCERARGKGNIKKGKGGRGRKREQG